MIEFSCVSAETIENENEKERIFLDKKYFSKIVFLRNIYLIRKSKTCRESFLDLLLNFIYFFCFFLTKKILKFFIRIFNYSLTIFDFSFLYVIISSAGNYFFIEYIINQILYGNKSISFTSVSLKIIFSQVFNLDNAFIFYHSFIYL